jgi:hypothetical protein
MNVQSSIGTVKRPSAYSPGTTEQFKDLDSSEFLAPVWGNYEIQFITVYISAGTMKTFGFWCISKTVEG